MLKGVSKFSAKFRSHENVLYKESEMLRKFGGYCELLTSMFHSFYDNHAGRHYQHDYFKL